MPNLPSIPDIINISKQALYKGVIRKMQQQAFLGGALPSLNPQLIDVISEALEWTYGINPTSSVLRPIANYLFSLCCDYGVISVATQTGFAVIPGTPGDQILEIRKRIQFQIGNSSTNPLMNAGDTSFVITDSACTNGIVDIHVDGGLEPIGIPTVPDYTTSWIPGQITVTFDTPAYTDAIYIVDYPIQIGLTIQSGTVNDNYYAQTINVETKDLLNGLGNIFLLTNNTNNRVEIEIQATDTDENSSIYLWQGAFKYKNGVITMSVSFANYIQNELGLSDFPGSENIVIAPNNSLGGVEGTVLGQNGKIINWYGKFTKSSTAL